MTCNSLYDACTTYEHIVTSWGYRIIDSSTFGMFQGDQVYLLESGSQVGFVVIGYGSCSGCDALQAIHMFNVEPANIVEQVNSLSDDLRSNIKWFDSLDDMASIVNDKDYHTNYWYWHEPDIKEYILENITNWPRHGPPKRHN
jgi:hypothetical protein